jgi:hypothetical protein
MEKNGGGIMSKKEDLVMYLLDVIQQMERELKRRVTFTIFADRVDLPIRTVTAMLDPDDARIPSRANAKKVAVGLGSNRINRILGYPDVDPEEIKVMRIYKQDADFVDFIYVYEQLGDKEKNIIMREMKRLVDDPRAEVVLAS